MHLLPVRPSTRFHPRFSLARASSPGFGSTRTDCVALFGLAFASPPPRRLKLAGPRKSQAHASIGTPQPVPSTNRRRRAVIACKRTVSGSISLPSRGSFHLSLTVLVRYRSPGVLSLTRWAAQIHAGFHEPHATRVPPPIRPPFAYRAFTFSGAPSQNASARLRIRHLEAPQPRSASTAV